MTLCNPNVDLVNANMNTKFGFILSICSQDIEQKPNSDVNQGPQLKMTHNNPNINHINVNVYIKFC